MTDRRRTIIDGPYEAATDKELAGAAQRFGARVYPKVRVADALDIDRSGISDVVFSYAMRAHFDFVVQRNDDPSSSFAVEFDGRSHRFDSKVRQRDALKEVVCQQLGMPLLRIDDGFLRRIGKFSVLGWLVELRFISQSFAEAQEAGQIPFDEPFCFFSVFDPARGSYDLSQPSRSHLVRIARTRRELEPVPSVAIFEDTAGHVHAIASIGVSPGAFILGHATSKAFDFQPIAANDVAEEFAIIEAITRVQEYLRGDVTPHTSRQAQALVQAWTKRKRGRMWMTGYYGSTPPAWFTPAELGSFDGAGGDSYEPSPSGSP